MYEIVQVYGVLTSMFANREAKCELLVTEKKHMAQRLLDASSLIRDK